MYRHVQTVIRKRRGCAATPGKQNAYKKSGIEHQCRFFAHTELKRAFFPGQDVVRVELRELEFFAHVRLQGDGGELRQTARGALHVGLPHDLRRERGVTAALRLRRSRRGGLRRLRRICRDGDGDPLPGLPPEAQHDTGGIQRADRGYLPMGLSRAKKWQECAEIRGRFSIFE